MQENKYNRLLKNTMIIVIGTFGSKILSFFIVPLYTHFLTTSEYGIVDVFDTTLELIFPFITLMIQESIVKFLLVDKKDVPSIVNCFSFVFLVGAFLTIIFFPVYKQFFSSQFIAVAFGIMLILNTYNAMFAQFIRGIDKITAYTINGVIVTFTSVFANVIFLIYLNWGLKGYIIAAIISEAASATHYTISGNVFQYLSLKNIDFRLLKTMLKFSIPIIPESLMWWIMSAGDVYVIQYFLGLDANGIYTVSLRLPTIISLFFGIFMQAWQVSALEEYSSADKTHFYENVFSMIITLMALCASGIMLIVKPFFKLLIDDAFMSAWQYVALLNIATAVNCCTSFFGIIYLALGDTKKTFYTTFLGAIVNLVFNVILIQQFGLFGVAVGTLLGYMAIVLVRMYHAKKYVGMQFNTAKILSMLALLIVQSMCVFVSDIKPFYLYNIILFVVIAALNRKDLLNILNFFIGKFIKKTL